MIDQVVGELEMLEAYFHTGINHRIYENLKEKWVKVLFILRLDNAIVK